ncbi:hypothetical protein [Lactococcus lactis]|uniref:Uncharacterized protein n=1 Tax=Lactococcus lactis TaxID=1358 RepID=A0AAP3Z2M5_9LACT|nr:hypothetical protein [Lactococcus lactis]MDG4969271.1 hypothetical protein [Lactococcus lactis]MDG4977202.1 hypothetical protein [Lactococcus lactis]MDG5103365.1 hypothetical protein [Lactococcus lactis]TNU78265.1 hypothetical protein FIB48_09530 [Lactococcus lactis subsp. lactis]
MKISEMEKIIKEIKNMELRHEDVKECLEECIDCLGDSRSIYNKKIFISVNGVNCYVRTEGLKDFLLSEAKARIDEISKLKETIGATE